MNPTHLPESRARRRHSKLPLLLVALAPLSACVAQYNDQIEVPGTNQRIIVGNDGWPNRLAWVLENGEIHELKFVRNKEK